MPRFRLWTLEELAARPRPKPVIANGFCPGDLAVIVGCPAFAQRLARIVGPAGVMLTLEPGDEAAQVLKRITPMRTGRHPSAVLLAFEKDCRLARWFAAEADAVFDAERLDYATVRRLRAFDDYLKGLSLESVIARIVDAW